jgi:lipopolysaccharide transport system permease protein
VLFGSVLSTLFGLGQTTLSWQMLWLPVLVAPLLLFSLGIAWLLAALGVFIRDIGQVTAFIVTVCLFASAIMFPVAKIHEGPPILWTILRFNPLLQIVDLARHTVLWHQPMPMLKLGYIYAVGVLMFAFGAIFFALLRRSFAEVI